MFFTAYYFNKYSPTNSSSNGQITCKKAGSLCSSAWLENWRCLLVFYHVYIHLVAVDVSRILVYVPCIPFLNSSPHNSNICEISYYKYYEILPTVGIQNAFIEITYNLSYKEKKNCFFQSTLVWLYSLQRCLKIRDQGQFYSQLVCLILSLKYTCGIFKCTGYSHLFMLLWQHGRAL